MAHNTSFVPSSEKKNHPLVKPDAGSPSKTLDDAKVRFDRSVSHGHERENLASKKK